MNITDLYKLWQKVHDKPMGNWFFSRTISAVVPYTGGLKARVKTWQQGYAKVELADIKANRNHLNSIHAAALTNLGEFASGLALTSMFDNKIRGIPNNINVDFIKKARGKLSAECKTKLPNFKNETQHTVTAEIKDTTGDIVAKVSVTWKLSKI